MLAGIVIGFFGCWQEALVCMAVSPIMAIGEAAGVELSMGLGDELNELQKEANLLCGDVIVNYRTVQSFGHEEEFVKKYEQMLLPGKTKAKATHNKTAIALGFSQFSTYAVIGVMFWAAGRIIKRNTDPETGAMTINPQDVFTAIFAIMFGASHAGSSAAMGPDIGKAMAASKRVFSITEQPSAIDAVEIDEQKDKIRLKLDEVKGKIEFKNVWFRYPTRKEDFVHRGLNLIVNPGESVALVGESGCGKSTFVNLLMRFYDVDEGEILLDDINIKAINLHDLRKAISLVMQEPVIFNYSILENVLYGKSNATNTEICQAARVANATEFIETKEENFKMDESAKNLISEMEK
jgi:ATP-binding cassette, subfamily B (MDR/TAP), member 1